MKKYDDYNPETKYALINSEDIRRIRRARHGKAFRKVLLGGALLAVSFAAGLNFRQSHDFVTSYELSNILAELSIEQEQSVNAVLLQAEDMILSTAVYNNPADIFNAVDNSVVSINITSQQRHLFGGLMESYSAGSGIIFHQTNERIYIVTNYHVVSGASSVTISLDDINESPASYVGSQPQMDIAVISVLRQDLASAGIVGYKIATFGDSSAMNIGNFVMAVGNAYGEGKSATLGIVSAMDKNITVDGGIRLTVLQTDAAINPGNSGGALVNTSGEVIGINTARLMTARSEGMGYAIPSNDVVNILSQIMQQGDVATPFLGVNIFTINEQTREYNNLNDVGIFVQGVFQGFAAYEMGLLPGDIITHFNNQRVYTSEELGRHISASAVGSQVELRVVRNQQVFWLSGVMSAYRGNGQTNF